MAARLVSGAVVEFQDLLGRQRCATRHATIEPGAASEATLDELGMLAAAGTSLATEEAAEKLEDDAYRTWLSGRSGPPGWVAAAIAKRRAKEWSPWG